MKIVVFGATGGTGTNVVAHALAQGHHVVAVARRPDAVKPAERLSVHKGDVFDAALVVSEGRGVADPHTDNSFWSAHGLRLAYRLGTERGLGAGIRLDGLWAPERLALRLGGAEVFETPRFLVRAGVDATYQF